MTKFVNDALLFRTKRYHALRDIMIEEGLSEKIAAEIWEIPPADQRHCFSRSSRLLYPAMDDWLDAELLRRGGAYRDLVRVSNTRTAREEPNED